MFRSPSSALADALRQSWRGKGALSCALLPLAWLFGAVTRLRRAAYARGLLRSTRLPVPVVVVGNVVAGGAGKTPVTIALAQALQRRGLKAGVVSRGYGRASRACLAVTAGSSAAEVGDEPLLIWQKTHAPVFVAASRAQAARALLARHPDTQIIISDDGLQHLAMQRDFEICVFNEKGVQNGRLLPAGPLREPWPRAVDAVLYHGNQPAGAFGALPAWQITRALAGRASNAHGQSIDLRSLAHGQRQPHSSAGPAPDVIAVAGIAEPQAFFDMLAAQGIALREAAALPDHADFAELPPVLRQPLPDGAVVLCTEKDAAKLWRRWPAAYAVPLLADVPDGLLELLAQRLGLPLPR